MKLFNMNFVNITLKTGQSVEKTKKHNLVLKIAIF